MPNLNALWATLWLSFALKKQKKPQKTQNTCLEKNDKCQQAFINIYQSAKCDSYRHAITFMHLNGPLVRTERLFLYSAYNGSVFVHLILFF